MGAKAAEMLTASGIEVIGGVSGNAGEALAALAAGALQKGDSSCAGQGSAGHTCGHQHHD
jgi:predicted Fe-Mo cluster-binding NifX family protein